MLAVQQMCGEGIDGKHVAVGVVEDNHGGLDSRLQLHQRHPAVELPMRQKRQAAVATMLLVGALGGISEVKVEPLHLGIAFQHLLALPGEEGAGAGGGAAVVDHVACAVVVLRQFGAETPLRLVRHHLGILCGKVASAEIWERADMMSVGVVFEGLAVCVVTGVAVCVVRIREIASQVAEGDSVWGFDAVHIADGASRVAVHRCCV